jgi:hypothetical protein
MSSPWHEALLQAEQEMVDVIVEQEQGFSPAAALNESDTASQWAEVKAVPEGNVPCDGCRGDGVYYGAGSVVNGVFKGFTGQCFRCSGKGSQTPDDVRRNTYYDNRVRRFSVD